MIAHLSAPLCLSVNTIVHSVCLFSSPYHTHSLSDLFWEQRHAVISMDLFTEETDRELPEYALPEQIERFIERGKYRNVENRVTRENYQRRMHNLLYLEEYRQREDMSR